MGSVHGSLFSSIKNRMLDWITISNDGNNVSDVCLDYLNEAQNELRLEALWHELLIISSALTVTDKVATLPSDVGEICSVYHADSNGKPTCFFYNKSIFSSEGYREINAGDKGTGFSKTIKFWLEPSSDVYLDYYKILDDFTGSGTEYSWFTGRLLLQKAQLMYLEDEGLSSTSEYSVLLSAFERSLSNFKRGHQNVNIDMRMVQRDNLGHVITFGAYNLSHGEDDRLWNEAYGNSADLKGYSYYAL